MTCFCNILCKNTKSMYNYLKTIHPLIKNFFFSIWLLHDIKKDKWHRDTLTLTGAEFVSAGPEVGLVTWATPQPSSDRIAAPVGSAPEFLESHSLPHSQTQFALWNSTTSGTFLKIEIISKFLNFLICVIFTRVSLSIPINCPAKTILCVIRIIVKYYDMWSIHKIYEYP